MNNDSGQIGVNPVPYNFSNFIEHDHLGVPVDNAMIEECKQKIATIYSRLPAYTSFTNEMLDKWVESNAGDDTASLQRYKERESIFLAVISIDSGFFNGHKVVIKNVEFLRNNSLQIEFSAIDATGELMDKPELIESIVQGIVTLKVYEQALDDLIKEEKETRLG